MLFVPPSMPTTEAVSGIPNWIKNIAGWLLQDEISESDFINSIMHLCNEKLITCGDN